MRTEPAITLPAPGCASILPNSRDQRWSRRGFTLDGADPFRRSRQRVPPQVHRRGARVVGLAFKPHFEPALPGDRRNHAQRKVQAFQHRALLDVKLQVTERRAGHARLADRRWIQTECANRVGDGHAASIALCEQRFVESRPRARGFR